MNPSCLQTPSFGGGFEVVPGAGDVVFPCVVSSVVPEVVSVVPDVVSVVPGP